MTKTQAHHYRAPASDRRALRSRGGLWLAPCAVVLLGAEPAHAAGVVDAASHTTARVVLLALVVGALFLLLKVVFERFRQKVLWVPGVEHVVLGLLVGPVIFGLGVFEDPTPLAPFAAVVAGWVALSCGTDFNLRALSDPPRGGPRLGVLSALICGLGVTFAAWAVFTSGWLGRVAADNAWLTAGWMGCAAAAASTAPLDVIQSRHNMADELPLLLRRSTRFANLSAIVAFGVLVCVFRPGYGFEDRPLSPVELTVVALGLGAVLGVVMAPYFSRAESLAGRVLVLAGMVAFGTGASFWLGLSPLWVSLAMGGMLVNISLLNDRIIEAVRAANPPALVVLLVLAGAYWSPPPLLPALAVGAGFVALRIVGRLLASWVAAKLLAPMRVDSGRGLLGHGEVAVALAIVFRVGNEGALVDIGYTAILASVVIHDLIAPWALRGLLLDAGALRDEAEAKV